MPQATTRIISSLAFLALLSGCDGLTTVCNLNALPALSVFPVDSISGEPPEGEVFVRASDGVFRDSIWIDFHEPTWEGGGVGLASERPGDYDVFVEAPGYEPWLRQDIRVTADRCHVRTVEVEARLQQ